jgi:hypothetical protein
MTISQTTRFELYTWTSGEDEFSRAQMTESNTSIANIAAIYLSGTSVVPPTIDATNDKSFYWDRTSSKLYFRGDAIADTTAHTWQQIFPVLPAGHIHIDLQPIDADLTALSALSSTGMMVRSAADTYSLRSIGVSGNGLTVSNADGTLGNPTITITAVSTNTPSSIVYRDSSGNFSAGTIVAALTGNASTATTWATSRSLTVSGDVSGTVSGINGSANMSVSLSLPTGNLTALRDFSTTGLISRTGSNTFASRTFGVSGTGLTISNADGILGNPTITISTDVAATANTVVLRDASSRFKAADPSASADVATKNYVDTVSALKANSTDVYTKTNVHSAKMYQYGNITAGGVDTSGGALPSTGTRTTPRIYVQSNDPTTAVGYVGITGDIWFAI